MGIEHEGIHLETSSVLMRELPLGLMRRPPQWPVNHASVAEPSRPAPENPLLPGWWGGCEAGAGARRAGV